MKQRQGPETSSDPQFSLKSPVPAETMTENELVSEFHQNAEEVVAVIVVRRIENIELATVGRESSNSSVFH